ncbi:hypothetical protein E2C01_033215 [Portunus trituberculatus]|uniref:Uncharacterized protein n=1 Tax=Portunus trituberculatus TaxID=210409 RepID=A0A5B7EXA4_PORTR|nr:hypothetical protein [Portunus trituberculatus]
MHLAHTSLLDNKAGVPLWSSSSQPSSATWKDGMLPCLHGGASSYEMLQLNVASSCAAHTAQQSPGSPLNYYCLRHLPD